LAAPSGKAERQFTIFKNKNKEQKEFLNHKEKKKNKFSFYSFFLGG